MTKRIEELTEQEATALCLAAILGMAMMPGLLPADAATQALNGVTKLHAATCTNPKCGLRQLVAHPEEATQ